MSAGTAEMVETPRARAGEAGARPAPARLAAALGRVEGRRLLTAPAVVVGYVLTVPALLGHWNRSEVFDLRRTAVDMAFVFLPLAAAVLVSCNLAALRSRRHGSDQLYASTPAPVAARTGGHLLGIAVVTAVAAGLAVVLVGGQALLTETVGAPDVLEMLVAPLLVAGAGALGVLLARWAPTPVAAPVACVVIAAFQGSMTNTSLLTEGWRTMAFWTYQGDLPPELLPGRSPGWHAAYLAGLVAMAAVGALLAHNRRRPVIVAGAVAVAVVAASAWFQTRPPSAADWAARNALLRRPADHQACDVREGTTYCAYPAYRSRIRQWAAVVSGVRRGVPAGPWPSDLTVGQRVTSADRQYVADSVLAGVLPDLPGRDTALPDDGALHPPAASGTTGGDELALAVLAASRTVGLPLAPDRAGESCDASGQGRAVVALWLAGQSTARAAGALRQLAAEQEVAPSGRTRFLVFLKHGTPPGVAWGAAEVDHALELLGRPAQQVRRALAADWQFLVAPDTSTAAAASRLGLSPVPGGPAGPDLHEESTRYGAGAEVRVGAGCPR